MLPPACRSSWKKFLVYGGTIGTILLFMFLRNGRRGARWRAFLESCHQKIPLLGKALQYLVLSRLAAALDALSNAGVNVTKAWELAAAAGGSQHLVGQVAGWSPKIEAGMTPAELVNQTRYFPEMFANLYHTGEISGKLDETLQRLHAYYQEEGFRFLRRFARVLNGCLRARRCGLSPTT